MTDREQRMAAEKFKEYWLLKGYEKGESQKFWISLLSDVFGVSHPEQYISFEKQVKLNTTSFIDGYIPETLVLIEQKSLGKNLLQEEKQSDGAILTPFEQAKRYSDELPYSEKPRWIVTCNFAEFHIYDMNKPKQEPIQILLRDLPKEYHLLSFLVDIEKENIRKEMEVSLKAGTIVGKLYDALYQQYAEPDSPASMKSLNMLCVRLVFCLYAEDAGIFGVHNQFYDYLTQYPARDMRRSIMDLFTILNTKPEERDRNEDKTLLAFPYVNGGLFADDTVLIPQFTEEIKQLLLQNASADFDWSDISPTIFGAVFESTLNPETRHSGGMHYTSIQNIHKVIDPLFLDYLKTELATIKKDSVIKTRNTKLKAFQQKLASLTFLDPACGSGNFLTQTYLSLRKLENDVLLSLIMSDKKAIYNQVALGSDNVNPIQVHINQFYGIEINDFAVTVAKTALWIAESQMMKETEDIVHMDLDFLPLKSYAHIEEGNALRMDWEDVVAKDELDYIMGNPPFLGYSLQSKAQKEDILSIYIDEKGKPYKTAGKIDYVAAWYFKAAQYMQNTNIHCAFVSTNSITQGEQVSAVWKPLYERFRLQIEFAHQTFKWNSETKDMAAVHCVIVGFCVGIGYRKKKLYLSDSTSLEAKNINPYLLDGTVVFIDSRNKPLYVNALPMTTGNRPADGGHLIIEVDEYEEFLQKEPNSIKYIKQLTGATEYINNKKRYCLWLVGANPNELRKMPEVMKRIELCRQDRLNGAADRQKLADAPTLFRETKNPKTAILVPLTSSERRKYIPLGFIDSKIITTNSATIIPNGTLYEFGILTSNVHMDWMRAVCGRLEMRYRYSKDVVYNNFPWCNPTDAQKQKIEETAQGILDARALYPDSSLADLYDEGTMPPELRKAHQQNDKAVMQAYGLSPKDSTESSRVAHLMELYQQKIDELHGK